MSTPPEASSPRFVKVATFSRLADADLARNRLESEGIPVVVLSDEATAGWFWHFGTAVGRFELRVPEHLLQRASDSLATITHGASAEEETVPPEEAFESDAACPECDSPIQPGVAACPTCGMVFDESAERSSPPPLPPIMGRGVPGEEPRLSPGDEVAARAYRAAIIGMLLLPPLLTLYSAWLLVRLACYSGEIGRAGIRKALAALAIDAAVLFVVYLVIRAFLRL